jgi:predicted thioesterase
MIEIGLKHTSEITVTDAVTAIKMGSGVRFIVDKERFMSKLG